MKNFPTEYDRFIKLAKNINETQYKRKKTVNSLTRVAQRYNLAKSFQGMNVDGIGKNTVLGYDVITKLFLSYCAYELTHDTARILLNSPKHETIRTINLTPIFGDDVTVKALQTNLKLKTFLLKNLDKEWWIKSDLDRTILTKFFNGYVKDIHILTRTLRNWFAHGNLTATPICTNVKERKSIDRLCNCILVATDELFTKCLTRF